MCWELFKKDAIVLISLTLWLRKLRSRKAALHLAKLGLEWRLRILLLHSFQPHTSFSTTFPSLWFLLESYHAVQEHTPPSFHPPLSCTGIPRSLHPTPMLILFFIPWSSRTACSPISPALFCFAQVCCNSASNSENDPLVAQKKPLTLQCRFEQAIQRASRSNPKL